MLQHTECIGLIGGGQMAEALIRGMLAANVVKKEHLAVIDPDPDRQKYLHDAYGILTCDSPQDICQQCTVLILAVKPQVCKHVLDQYAQFLTSNHLLISILAGVTIRELESLLPAKSRIVRVMPNTPALVLAGASAISLNANATEADRKLSLSIFSAIGLCIEVQETQLDAVTGLSGSGPGYIFTMIDGLIDGGVLAGLPRNTAEQLVLQTIYGSAKLAMESDKNPAALKAQVTSPGGTTIKGIQLLEQRGVRSALMDAVLAATNRSKELGE
jgi:pyrroline-5-carboxylate reductase